MGRVGPMLGGRRRGVLSPQTIHRSKDDRASPGSQHDLRGKPRAAKASASGAELTPPRNDAIDKVSAHPRRPMCDRCHIHSIGLPKIGELSASTRAW